MFTGLIQAIGKVRFTGKSLLIEGGRLPFDLNIGDSVAVDGVCLTVSSFRKNGFMADISEETLKRTNLANKAENSGFVNLEPALRLSDRLGGHLVSGHVDGLGMVMSLEEFPNSWKLEVQWNDKKFAKYICDKASISLNGISLTVAESVKEGEGFSIAIIPHTWVHTSLKYLLVGESVNLEVDLMAKYAESILLNKNYAEKKMNIKSPELSNDWLESQGWK